MDTPGVNKISQRALYTRLYSDVLRVLVRPLSLGPCADQRRTQTDVPERHGCRFDDIFEFGFHCIVIHQSS